MKMPGVPVADPRSLLVVTVAALASIGSPAAAQSATTRPWLGIAMQSDAHSPGVLVAHVVRGSPADRAGVREGDRVVRVAGETTSHSADVAHAVAEHGVGDVIEVAFLHAGQEVDRRATLAPFPAEDEMMRMDLVGTFAPTWHDLEPVSGAFPPSVNAARGRVMILDFWATWCAPCRVVAPKLDALQARYGAQGLTVLGLSTEDPQDVASFAQHMAIHYGMAVDRHALTSRAYGVASLPSLVVIDKRGVVRDVSVGYDPGQDGRLEATLRTLLAEPAPRD